MSNEEAIDMLDAKRECIKRKISGTGINCIDNNCNECELNYYQGNMGEQQEALDMAIKALEQTDLESYSDKLWRNAYERGKAEQTRWIPVSERLPEDNTYVLVTVQVNKREPKVRSGFYYREGHFHIDTWRARDKELKAWMPLPQPYKAEQQTYEEYDYKALWEQVKWERDVAIEQLEQLGYSLGEKIRTDGDCISRKDLLNTLEEPLNWTDSEAEIQEQRDYKSFVALVKSIPSVTPKITHLTDRPCSVCEFHTDKGCSKWGCVFEGSEVV